MLQNPDKHSLFPGLNNGLLGFLFLLFLLFFPEKNGGRRGLFGWEMNHTNFWVTSGTSVVYGITIHYANTSEWFFQIPLQSRRITTIVPVLPRRSVHIFCICCISLFHTNNREEPLASYCCKGSVVVAGTRNARPSVRKSWTYWYWHWNKNVKFCSFFSLTYLSSEVPYVKM